MTREEMWRVSVGQDVVSPHSSPPNRPYRITKLHLPKDGTPMCQLRGYPAGQWVHLEAFDLAPANAYWNPATGKWQPRR